MVSTKNIIPSKMKLNPNLRKLSILVIFVLLFIQNVPSNLSNNTDIIMETFEEKELETTIREVHIPLIPHTQEVIFQPVYGQNMAQFNITEKAIFRDTNTEIDINSQNASMRIPDSSSFVGNQFQIDTVYKRFNVTQDGNITMGQSNGAWAQSRNPNRDGGLWSYGWLMNSSNQLNIRTNGYNLLGNPYGTILKDYLAEYSQTVTKFDPTINVTKGEFLRAGQAEQWRNSSFFDTPAESNWEKLYDMPYGGIKKGATTYLNWTTDGFNGYLQAYIRSGDVISDLGNPSIAHKARFNLTGAYKSAKLYLGWAIQNGPSGGYYTFLDNVSVMARVDENFVDGRRGFNGENYLEGTPTTLETDDYPGSESSHGTIGRVYDVTSLINKLLSEHTFDFGVWMKSTNHTNAEVNVLFDYAVLSLVEEDLYKIGDLQFEVKVDYAPKGAGDFQNVGMFKNLTIYSYFGPMDRALGTYSIWGTVYDFLQNPGAGNSILLSVDIDSRALPFFDIPTFQYSFGIVCTGTTSHTNFTSVSFDNIRLRLYYGQKNPTIVGLQVKNNEYNWEDVSKQNNFFLGPINATHTNLQFRTNNITWNNSRMRYSSEVWLQQQKIHDAIANFRVDNWNPNKVYWNVTYNTTSTIASLRTVYDWNQYKIYNITYVDLPAFDGFGKNTNDWRYYDTIGPQSVNFSSSTIRTPGSLLSPFLQNITIVNATQMFNMEPLNGSFTLYLDQPNYLSSTALMLNPNIYTETFYNGNISSIKGNQTVFSYAPSGIPGNYTVNIANASDNTTIDFPKYYLNIARDLDVIWTVSNEEGLGKYYLRVNWNDTTNGITKRVGYRYDTFFIYNTTIGTLIYNSTETAAGEKALIKINYNQTAPYLTGIQNATIQVYNNDTGKIWGLDFPPYVPLLDTASINYLGDGNYSFFIKTTNVPKGFYNLTVRIWKSFFDIANISCNINITGESMNVDFTQGVISTPEGNYLPATNIPYVNDTSTCKIQLNVTTLSGSALRYGFVSGVLNSSSAISQGFELYSITQNPDDKGIYNITIDTTGVNSTDYPDYNNYTLTLTISVPGYQTKNLFVNVSVLRLPTQVTNQPIASCYEGSTFSTFADFQTTFNPKPIDNALFPYISWKIANNSKSFNGSYLNGWYGVFEAIIDLGMPDAYIFPGIYNFTVFAGAWNCQNATWTQGVFEVKAKTGSGINLTVNDEVRIGGELQVQAVLYNLSSGLPLEGYMLNLKIIYETISFDVVGTTNAYGVVSYTQIVQPQYENTVLYVNVTFIGTSLINSAFDNETRLIMPRIPASITFLNLPNANLIRVGYSTSFIGKLSIQGVSVYDDRFLTLTILYGSTDEVLPVYQKKRCNTDGTINFTIDELSDGFANVTFRLEFTGTTTIAYAINQTFYSLIPKWSTQLSMTPLPQTTRIGQTVLIQISANFVDPTCWETFYGTSALIIFHYNDETQQESFEKFFDSTNKIIFNYTIPQTCGTSLRIEIIFNGNVKLSICTAQINVQIFPKWTVNFIYMNFPTSIHLGQKIQLRIQVSFAESNPTESLLGLSLTISIAYSEYSPSPISGLLNSEGLYIYEFSIPLDAGAQFSLSVSISETLTITGTSKNEQYNLKPQETPVINLLSKLEQEDYAGTFNFAVNLVDSDQNPIVNQTVIFVIKDGSGKEIERYSATTNEQGQAAVEVIFEEIGDYTVEILFPSADMYAQSSSDGYTVHVVNVVTLMMRHWMEITIAAAIIVSSLLTFNRAVIVPRRRRYQEAILAIAQQFQDAENIQYVMISHNKTGLSLFAHGFTEIPIDETLISGFLSAVSSFGQELAGKTDAQKSQETGSKSAPSQSIGLEELGYKQFRIAVFEAKMVRTCILLLKSASPSLKASVREFNEKFELKYSKILEDWAGKTIPSEPILELIEQTLQTDLLYPHNVIKGKMATFKATNKIDGKLLTEAATPQFNFTFRVREMINHMIQFGIRDVDTFNAIHRLRKAQIVFAVNPRTKYLIDQFQPFIDQLNPIERNILTRIIDGVKDPQELAKELNIADINQIMEKLIALNMITSNFILTEIGEVIGTLLKLIPNF